MKPTLNDTDALLIVGTSEEIADLYYATRFLAPDPLIFIWTAEEKILLASDLELDRARQHAEVDRILPYSLYEKKAHSTCQKEPVIDDVICELLRELKVQRLMVPDYFPISIGDALRNKKFSLTISSGPVFPERQIKNATEIEHVANTQRAAEAGMSTAISLLQDADIVDGTLFFDGKVLTSERLRHAIHITLMEFNCSARHTIVACGNQACDPHQEGFGPLRSSESIIVDIFPSDNKTKYFGDITRTIVKGPVPPKLLDIYNSVLKAQELALEHISSGACGTEIHKQVQFFFESNGYQTTEKDGTIQGFFHGTGHGLGIEIHEAPRISRRGDILREGNIVTVEPGLYYRDIGGVRIEDTVVVRSSGYENLTSFPKKLEIP